MAFSFFRALRWFCLVIHRDYVFVAGEVVTGRIVDLDVDTQFSRFLYSTVVLFVAKRRLVLS